MIVTGAMNETVRARRLGETEVTVDAVLARPYLGATV